LHPSKFAIAKDERIAHRNKGAGIAAQIAKCGVELGESAMTERYLESHLRLNRILKFFFIVCLVGILIGIQNHDWIVAAVWLVAGFINGVIEFPVRELGTTQNARGDNESIGQRLLVGNIGKFSRLVAWAALASALVLQEPWWAVLGVGAAAWLIAMYGATLHCSPPKQA
jgi:hypothetical protein